MTASEKPLGSRLGALLGVEAGEGRATGLMAGLYFVLAVAFVFVQTTAFGLFVGEFGSRNLPFAYLSVALLASGIAFAYLRLQDRLAFKPLLFVNLAFGAAVCLIFWLGLRSSLAHWFIFFLPFWFQALLNLANLAVWTLAGRIFDVRQAKRLYGLVQAGNWLANILGGLVIGSILASAGTANPYLFAAIAVIGAGFVLWSIFRLHLVPAAPAPTTEAAVRPSTQQKAASSPFRSTYNRLIFAKVGLWWMGFYFIDNIFLDRAGVQFQNGAELAAFLGRQLSVVGVIAIITSTFLTGRIIRKYGVRTGLFLMPAVVASCALLLVLGGALNVPAAWLFWIATAAKTLNLALGFSVSQASATLLYQPILGDERNRIQTIAEGIIQPAAIGVAALLLLLFNTTLHLNAVGLAAIFLPIAAVWLWVIYRVTAEYPRVLSAALVRRSLGESTMLMFDPAGVAQLQAGLKSPNAGVALYAVGQLEALEPDAWRTKIRAALPNLLSHPAGEVRAYVLRCVTELRLVEAVPSVRERLGGEPDVQVQALIVQALAALNDRESTGQIKSAIDSPERAIREGAITGLLGSGEASQIELGGNRLRQLAGSTNEDDRLTAAQVLTRAQYSEAPALIRGLLEDESATVRRAALRAAGHQEDLSLIGNIVDACGAAETVAIAERTLLSKGSAAIPAILAKLGAQRGLSGQSAQVLVRVLGATGSAEAIAFLQARIGEPDAELRRAVLRALDALGYRVRPMQKLAGRIRAEVADAAWIASAMSTLEEPNSSKQTAALQAALETAFQQTRERVVLLLSFGTDAQAVKRAAVGLEHAGDHPAGFALEAMDVLLPVGLKPVLLPLLESLPVRERISRWESTGVSERFRTVDAVVETLLDPECARRFSHWVHVCAIYAAGALRMKPGLTALEALSAAPDGVVAEASRWSLAQIMAEGARQGEVAMLSLVERVLALKSSSLFSRTPDNVLADVAERVQEVTFDKGQVIFNKGDHGDSLYIIVSGNVQAWNGDRLLNELGEGAIFGELALLDPAPRAATLKAVDATHLLELDRSQFQLVMAERPEVSTAIISVLTGYLRTHLHNVEEFDAELKKSRAAAEAGHE